MKPTASLLRRRVLLVSAGLLTAFTTLAVQAQGPVRVGSKFDTEGKLLGNIIVLALEANGIKTESKVSLGNTKVVRTALLAGEIDIYPEYTGNGAFMLGDENNKAWKNLRAGYELAKKMDMEKNHIVWLEPANANNTWAIAVRKDVATANKLVTLDDMGKYIAGGGNFKLAASAEFMERADAMPAFQAAYGFKLKPDQALVLAGGDTSATIKAAAEKTSGVNAAMAYGTDGPISALGLVAMEDPKGVQPVYAPAPLVREEVLKQHPNIATILAPIFKSLDGPTLQMLNARIQLDGADARKTAGDYLRSKGLLPKIVTVPVLALCLALAYAAAWALPLVRVAPNRLLSGEGVGLTELLTGPQCALAWGAGVALLLLAAAGRRHRAPQALLTAALACALPLLWWLAARHADTVVLTESPRFRTALGAGFWSLLALAWLACLDAIARLRLRPRHQLLVVALATAPMVLALGSGMGNELSIMKEFTNRREVFGAAVLRHLQIVALACVPAVVLGWPLAWALVRWRALQRWSLPVLNIIQTIPSIALFGLLMAPLGWAAAQWPWLQSAGVRGVGLAPAVLALLLYALLPIVRSAMAGLQNVPVAVTTAARAMGMGPWHIVWQVELPLAWPVLMAGLRTAVVQTIGLAAVTALVGAGGLGSIMFDGLFSAANELVILGVVPIVLLAVLADAGFKALAPLAPLSPTPTPGAA